MNKAQKDALKQACIKLEEVESLINDIRDELQSEFDDKSDKWRESEAGSAAEDAISNLTDAADTVDTAKSVLDDYTG